VWAALEFARAWLVVVSLHPPFFLVDTSFSFYPSLSLSLLSLFINKKNKREKKVQKKCFTMSDSIYYVLIYEIAL